MVFDIEIKDFHRKACLVVGGHTLDTLTYFSVVKREIVCFALTMVALYDLDVKAADVLNDYMMASNK